MRYELSDKDGASFVRCSRPSRAGSARRRPPRSQWHLGVAIWRSLRVLPALYGPRTTCYNRFVRWRRAGIWESIMQAVVAAQDVAVQMIDTSAGHHAPMWRDAPRTANLGRMDRLLRRGKIG
jgi:transposase